MVVVIAGCSLEKKSALNRGLQNLTTKYNILFNANQLLNDKQAGYAASYIDDYNEILSVYQDTTLQPAEPDKDLELVKVKANNIISVKEQSHYIGDAYLILGKSNFLEGNYFDAVEYFSYVTRSFADNADLKQEALTWKARALLYLNKAGEAKMVLDTALQNINPKKNITADVYAAKLQCDINTQDYADGEEMAKQAVKLSHNKTQELRWTFILGQLQELNHHSTEAVINYSHIVNSNALFNMAFNANLNRIRIENGQNSVKLSRLARLRLLLKNTNNKEFTDQVYYQIAQLQYADMDIDNAIKNYKLSAKSSIKNQNQKGLSYLRLADIYFKNKADYAQAKNYYDSTLLNLSPGYPGFNIIKKKSDNLQLLADRLQLISREDTLQMLAALDEATRNKRIDVMVNRNTLQQQATAAAAANTAFNPLIYDPADPLTSTPNGGKFYFYNATAIGQGFTDFRRVWGNRKLEDNWRRSNRAASDISVNTSTNIAVSTDPDSPSPQAQYAVRKVDAASYRQDIVQNLPLNPSLLAQSNSRVYNAYVDIANFYRDVLGDKKEAIAAYEMILGRFSGNPNNPAVYYNLYRLYSENNITQSDTYKDLLLKQYPETPFAKTILDPDYSKKLNEQDNGFSSLYNKVYDLYAAKQYLQVITAADELLAQYPNSRYAAQLAYFRAYAGGHLHNLAPFKSELEQIIVKYPADKLITPLVAQHLTYINTNQADLAARNIVISDNNPGDVEFTLPIVDKQQTEYRVPFTGRYEPVADVRAPDRTLIPAVQAPKAGIKQQLPTSTNINLPKGVTQAGKPVVTPANAAPSIFNMRDSTNYYFVVNVNSGTTNLASSRFGIGQFNRVQFEGNAIKHQLKNAGADNQLIYVGRFTNLANVKDYARAIIPLMPDIMKVPKDKYSFFIITQENLNKLADKKTLDSYIDYYQTNY